MGELSSNQLWEGTSSQFPSLYARMIPGASVTPRSRPGSGRVVPTSDGAQRSNAELRGKDTSIRARLKKPTEKLRLESGACNRFLDSQSIASDLAVLVTATGGASLLSPSLGLPWAYLPVFVVLVTLVGSSQGLYTKAGDDPFPSDVVLVLTNSILVAIGLVWITGSGGVHLLAAVVTSAGSLGCLVLARRLRQIRWSTRRRDSESRKVLIVGGGRIARAVASTLSDPCHRTTVCGFLDDDLPLSKTVLGRVDDLDWLARAQFIDEVILAIPEQPAQARVAAEVAFRNHLDIRAVPDLPAGPWLDSGVDHIGDVPVVTLHRESLPSGALFLKRLLDVTGTIVALAAATPLMAAISVFIRLESPGPVVYAAERMGAKGRRFRCYKFRSMVADADRLKDELRARNQREGPIFKIHNDPRITRIGRILRRYSLDELPQLWNVLRGEMSLVGPRPHPVEEVNHYELQHYRRLDVKPGITGLWQITARNCPSFDLNMHLDLTYIENWSLRLDLRILANTVRVLFAPEGA